MEPLTLGLADAAEDEMEECGEETCVVFARAAGFTPAVFPRAAGALKMGKRDEDEEEDLDDHDEDYEDEEEEFDDFDEETEFEEAEEEFDEFEEEEDEEM